MVLTFDSYDKVGKLSRAMIMAVAATTAASATTPTACAAAPSSQHHWVVWQMLDSLYPTGGFAHSQGLEAAVQENVVRPRDGGTSLREFLTSTVFQTGNFALPIVFSSISAVTSNQQQQQHQQHQPQQPTTLETTSQQHDSSLVDAVLQLNTRASALYSNHVAKKASLAQGAALLRLAISTYHQHPTDRFRVLLAIRKQSKQTQNHTHAGSGIHHAVVFGVVCGLLDVDSEICQRMFLFVVLRDTLSAATRLNLVGPMEATRIQFDLAHVLDKVVATKKNRCIDQSYSSAPVLDLIQAMHDQLYTRIFNS